MNKDRLSWNRLANKYDKIMKKDDVLYDKLYKIIKPYLNRNQSVLELCCGTGELSCKVAPTVKIYEATDFSKSMIEVAKQKKALIKVTFFCWVC